MKKILLSLLCLLGIVNGAMADDFTKISDVRSQGIFNVVGYTGEATVVYVASNYVFAQDATGQIALYQTETKPSVGDVINFSGKVTKGWYDNNCKYINIASGAITSLNKTDSNQKIKTFTDISKISAADYGTVVKLENVSYKATYDDSNNCFVDANGKYVYRASTASFIASELTTFPTDATKKYDVTILLKSGIAGSYYQYWLLECEEHSDTPAPATLNAPTITESNGTYTLTNPNKIGELYYNWDNPEAGLDTDAWTGYVSAITTDGLSAGEHTLCATVIDGENGTMSTVATKTVTVTAPTPEVEKKDAWVVDMQSSTAEKSGTAREIKYSYDETTKVYTFYDLIETGANVKFHVYNQSNTNNIRFDDYVEAGSYPNFCYLPAADGQYTHAVAINSHNDYSDANLRTFQTKYINDEGILVLGKINNDGNFSATLTIQRVIKFGIGKKAEKTIEKVANIAAFKAKAQSTKVNLGYNTPASVYEIEGNVTVIADYVTGNDWLFVQDATGTLAISYDRSWPLGSATPTYKAGDVLKGITGYSVGTNNDGYIMDLNDEQFYHRAGGVAANEYTIFPAASGTAEVLAAKDVTDVTTIKGTDNHDYITLKNATYIAERTAEGDQDAAQLLDEKSGKMYLDFSLVETNKDGQEKADNKFLKAVSDGAYGDFTGFISKNGRTLNLVILSWSLREKPAKPLLETVTPVNNAKVETIPATAVFTFDKAVSNVTAKISAGGESMDFVAEQITVNGAVVTLNLEGMELPEGVITLTVFVDGGDAEGYSTTFTYEKSEVINPLAVTEQQLTQEGGYVIFDQNIDFANNESGASQKKVEIMDDTNTPIGQQATLKLDNKNFKKLNIVLPEGLADGSYIIMIAAGSIASTNNAKVVNENIKLTLSVATGIKNVEVNSADAVIFNAAGQRINRAQRGLYIINGKKVVLK